MVERLGYIGFEVPNPAAWAAFFSDVVGLMRGDPSPDGSLTFRLDEYAQRFVVSEGSEDDVAFVGWEVKDAKTLDTMARRLRDAGVAVAEGDSELAAARRVERVLVFEDPNGLRSEVFWGPTIAKDPFYSAHVPSGFLTGACGLGHIVFGARDWQRTFDFYVGVLGLRLSDYIKGSPIPGLDLKVHITFLHANPRHHSCAFLVPPFPFPKKLQHFMIEAREMSSVGRAYDRFRDSGTPIALTLGHHPNDGAFSFYAQTPNGIEIEFGWGGVQIDDAVWQPRTYSQLSDWGHRRE